MFSKCHFTSSRIPILPCTFDSANKMASRDFGQIGLVSRSDTCYINTILQSMYNFPEFRSVLCTLKYSKCTLEEILSTPCENAVRFVQTIQEKSL